MALIIKVRSCEGLDKSTGRVGRRSRLGTKMNNRGRKTQTLCGHTDQKRGLG